jgi:hypothetical protein
MQQPTACLAPIGESVLTRWPRSRSTQLRPVRPNRPHFLSATSRLPTRSMASGCRTRSASDSAGTAAAMGTVPESCTADRQKRNSLNVAPPADRNISTTAKLPAENLNASRHWVHRCPTDHRGVQDTAADLLELSGGQSADAAGPMPVVSGDQSAKGQNLQRGG